LSEWTNPGVFDRRLVHAGGVKIGDLPQRRLRTQGSIVLRELERRLELTSVALEHFLEPSPSRAIGRNLGALEPVAVHIGVEIGARTDGGVQICDIQR